MFFIIFLLFYIDVIIFLLYDDFTQIMKGGDIVSVGSRIKELREHHDLSRAELAEKLNVTIGAISNYENGISSPKEAILFKIMEVLRCDANYLFQDVISLSKREQFSVSEIAYIKKYRALDDHGKDMVDVVLDKEWERSTSKDAKNIVEMKSHLTVNAAHARTDIEVSDDKDTSDDDIMKNDDLWK